MRDASCIFLGNLSSLRTRVKGVLGRNSQFQMWNAGQNVLVLSVDILYMATAPHGLSDVDLENF